MLPIADKRSACPTNADKRCRRHKVHIINLNSFSRMIDVKKVADKLVRLGAKRINNCVVRSASVIERDSYNTIVLRLNTNVPMMVRKELEDGTEVWERGESNTVFITSISLNAVLGYNPELAAIRRYLLEEPEDLEMLLSYATVDVIQESVTAGTDDEGNPFTYVNPFSENGTERVIEHDSWYTHLINIDLGDTGYDIVDDIKDALREARRQRVIERRKNASKRGHKDDVEARRPRRRVDIDESEVEEPEED